MPCSTVTATPCRFDAPLQPGFESWVQTHERGTFHPQGARNWHLLTLGFAALGEQDLAHEQLDTLRGMDAGQVAHAEALLR